MGRRIFVPLALGCLLVLWTIGASAGTGNGAPSGPHYNLNLIGVPKDKSADLTNSDGHSIFVPLSGSCKINL